VPNVRTCCSRAPVRPGTRTHATTVFLWTSSPQTALDHPLHGVTSTAMCAGARRTARVIKAKGMEPGPE
jgi:hypothetical protein